MTPALHVQPRVLALVCVGPSRASLLGMARTNRISAAALLGFSRNDNLATGWILPNGKFAANAPGCHLESAAALGCAEPEKMGWAHVSAGVVHAGDRRPTRAQTNTILDLVGEGRCELPGFMMAQAA